MPNRIEVVIQPVVLRFSLSEDKVVYYFASDCHHDHMGSAFRLPGADLVMGQGEADFCEEPYGPEETAARLAVMGKLIEVPRGGELELMPGVMAISTPGHTPGHISVMAESETGQRVIVAGDTVMTRREYSQRTFSHWYTDTQLRGLHASLDRIHALEPTTVMPGHDRAFSPTGALP